MNVLEIYVVLSAGCAAIFAAIIGLLTFAVTGDNQIAWAVGAGAFGLAFPGALLILCLAASASRNDPH